MTANLLVMLAAAAGCALFAWWAVGPMLPPSTHRRNRGRR